MESITPEFANALGFRDRCNGGDAEDRVITLGRFGRSKRLKSAYWRGWRTADDYLQFMMEWSAGLKTPDKTLRALQLANAV